MRGTRGKEGDAGFDAARFGVVGEGDEGHAGFLVALAAVHCPPLYIAAGTGDARAEARTHGGAGAQGAPVPGQQQDEQRDDRGERINPFRACGHAPLSDEPC